MSRVCYKIISLAVLLKVSCWLAPAMAGSGQVAIASAHPLATYAGLKILDKGGNAFDAAVAVSAALAVVEPSGSGLGGGGFWLIHRHKDGYETMIDGREKAPLAAHRDMYLDSNGTVNKRMSKDGPLAAGIPGMPAAIVHLSLKYGQLSLAESLQPAIELARNGFLIGARHLKLLKYRKEVIENSKAATAIFLTDNEIPEPESLLRQLDLARTLEKIAESGKAGFYAGSVAEQLLNSVRAKGGIWLKKDLEDYQIVEREPVRGEYRGIRITSAAPPSSGGIVLIEALNILSGFNLQAVDEITRKHLIIEALRRAYHDRAVYLGDPDFVEIPVNLLLNRDYAAGLRTSIRVDRSLPSSYLKGSFDAQPKGRNTTHFSIIDSQGNRVAATLSINFPFGSGFVAEGTGVLLNDEMDDFVSLPGDLNGYGLVGGKANSIASGKRMLSSMTPTFVEDENRIAVLGTPGGSRIISMVLLAVLDFALGREPDSWVGMPRFHHQYIPDQIQYEKGALTVDEISGLSGLGHQLKEISYRYGNMQSVQWHKRSQQMSAASDPRGEGLAIARDKIK